MDPDPASRPAVKSSDPPAPPEALPPPLCDSGKPFALAGPSSVSVPETTSFTAPPQRPAVCPSGTGTEHPGSLGEKIESYPS